MNCTQCGGENLEYKSGISKKNGRPWSGNKCRDCGNMDFIKSGAPASYQQPPAYQQPQAAYQAPRQAPRQAPVQSHEKFEMLISYAKDVVVAEIAKGIEVKEPFKRIADGFKVLLMARTHPFGAPKPATPPVPEVDLGGSTDAPHEELPF